MHIYLYTYTYRNVKTAIFQPGVGMHSYKPNTQLIKSGGLLEGQGQRELHSRPRLKTPVRKQK